MNPTASPQQTREANAYLLECERTSFSFLAVLLQIFEGSQDMNLRLQALIYFNNILKRNWNNKRQNRNSPNFESDKTLIKQRLVEHLRSGDARCLPSLLDVIVFISKHDFPHNFQSLSEFILETYRKLNSGNVQQPLTLNYLRGIQKVYREQLSKKSFVSKRVFQEMSMPVLVEAFNRFNAYGECLGDAARLNQLS